MRRVFSDIRSALSLPVVDVSLEFALTTGNDDFFKLIIARFFRDATRRHPKLPIIGNMQYGMAMFRMPGSVEDYIGMVEASARRNVKKAIRLGYSVTRLDYNANLEAIQAIWRSTEVRQGRMPKEILHEQVRPISDPPTRSNTHDYVYLGAYCDGQLRGYVAALVAGELLAITVVFGHFDYQPDGVVPLLFVQLVKYALANYPHVKYCMYDKYFGASETLRRFKRKFGFVPYKVRWCLG